MSNNKNIRRLSILTPIAISLLFVYVFSYAASSTTIGANISTSGTLTVSSTATSTFAGGVQVNVLDVASTTATSTFANGIVLSGGCFKDAIGNCIQTGGGTRYIGGGDKNIQYNNTGAYDGSSDFVWDYTNLRLGVGTSSPYAKLSVAGQTVAAYFTATTTSISTLPNLTATNATTTSFGINSETFTDLTGAGLQNTAGVLTLNATGNWTGTFDGQEGTYYLDARNLTGFGTPFYTFFSATTTSALAEGTNQYWTITRFDNRLSASSSISGITTLPNLSITGSQVANLSTLWDNRFAATTTTGLAEGTNQYWTTTRFDNRLSATTTLPNLTTLRGLTNASTSLLTVSGQSFFNSSTTFNGVMYGWPASGGSNRQVLTVNGMGGLLWANAGATFVGTTTSSYDGAFTSGADTGYKAANNICSAQYSGSHFCQTHEIINTIAFGDFSTFSGTAWIAEGPPGYTSNSNDCTGYTTNNSSYLGAFWEFLSTNGGRGWLVNCSQSKPIACCR